MESVGQRECIKKTLHTLCTPSVPKGNGLPVVVSIRRTSASRMRSVPLGKAFGINSLKCATYRNDKPRNITAGHLPKMLERATALYIKICTSSLAKTSAKVFALCICSSGAELHKSRMCSASLQNSKLFILSF